MLKAATILVSYLIGSIPFGFLLVKYAFARGEDIRKVGSGGIGATNVARRSGWTAGLLTYLLDFGKGAVCVFIARMIDRDDFALMGAAALASMSGHVFPLFLGFRGGKGVATGAGAFILLAPYPLLSALAVWALVALITRYVSLASMLAAVSIPAWTLIYYWWLWPDRHVNELLVTGLVAAGLIVFKHSANISRLLNGIETKIGQRVGPA
jgi:glycerol-3-phosphate acyltransferase PlsY